MFKRIKVITLLITVLLALGAMQLISAGVFIGALNNDKQNFNVSQLSSQNVAEFTDAWISLNQARVTLNRGMLRLQGTMASEINGGQLKELVNTANRLLAESKEHYDKYYALPETPGLDEHLADRLEEQYGIYSATLAKMNALLAEGKLEEMFKWAVDDINLKIRIEPLKNEETPAVLLLDENMRRYQEAMRLWGSDGMPQFPLERTLVLNSQHPLVQNLANRPQDDTAKDICLQLTDLAEMAQQSLPAERMNAFISRSLRLMTELATEEKPENKDELPVEETPATEPELPVEEKPEEDK